MKRGSSFLNAAEIMDTVIAIFKKSVFQQLAAYICSSIIIYAVMVIFVLFGGMLIFTTLGISDILSEFNLASLPFELVFFTVVLLVILIFIIMLAMNFMQSVVSILAWQAFSDRKLDLGDAFKRAFTSLSRMATIAIAQIFIGIPLLILWVALIYFIFSITGIFNQDWFEIFDAATNLAGAIPVIATFIVILLTFLLGLIIYHYFILAVPAGLFDRKHFFAALIHSYRLIKGEFWKTLGIRCIFYGGIIMLQYSLMSLPGGLIGILIAFTSDNPILLVSISSTAWLLYYGISIITGVIASSFINILTSVIFFNQKMKKEGLHIAMILERLESTLHGF